MSRCKVGGHTLNRGEAEAEAEGRAGGAAKGQREDSDSSCDSMMIDEHLRKLLSSDLSRAAEQRGGQWDLHTRCPTSLHPWSLFSPLS